MAKKPDPYRQKAQLLIDTFSDSKGKGSVVSTCQYPKCDVCCTRCIIKSSVDNFSSPQPPR